MKIAKLLLIVLLLGSCGAKKEVDNPHQALTLAIGYIPNMQFAPFYVGMEEGFFAKEGIDLAIEYGMGNDILSLVASGRVELALGDADQYLLAQKQGLPLTAIYQYYQVSPVAIIALDDRIMSPADLKGKRIGVSELFGSSYLSLLEFLDYYDIMQSEVEIVRVGYTQTTALTSGEVHAVVVFANNEPLELAKHHQSYRIWSAEEFSSLSGALIMSHTEYWQNEQKRNVLEAFQRALTQSIHFIRENPEMAAMITQSYVDGSDYDDILAGIHATLAFFSENGGVNDSSIRLTEERLASLGFL